MNSIDHLKKMKKDDLIMLLCEKYPVQHSNQVVNIIKENLDIDWNVEQLIIAVTDGVNNIISQKILSVGSLNRSIVSPAQILKYILQFSKAAGFILIHNHPSGNLQPSDQDIEVTNKMKEVATLMQLTMLDHIIISEVSHFSLCENGLL